MRDVTRIIAAAGIILLGVTPARAEDHQWLFSTSVNYSRGDYGTHQTTEILYVPFTFGVIWDRLDLRLTIPYLRLTSEEVTLTGGGVAVQQNPPSPAKTHSGLGDVLLRGQVIVFEEGDVFPEIAPYLKIKFPTADEDKGLGTGKFDETLGVDLAKTFLAKWTGYLTLAYTFIGKPKDSHFHDSWSWSLGAAYSVTRPLSVYAFLDYAQAISSHQVDPAGLRFGAEYRLTKIVKLTSYIGVGLTHGEADFGAGGGIVFRF